MERELKSVHIVIEEFDIEISDLPKDDYNKYSKSLKLIEDRYKKAKIGIKNAKNKNFGSLEDGMTE